MTTTTATTRSSASTSIRTRTSTARSCTRKCGCARRAASGSRSTSRTTSWSTPSGDDDVYSLTADWISGYPTAFYDVQIDLRDADTGALVASAGSERARAVAHPAGRPGPRYASQPAAAERRWRRHAARASSGGGAIGGWFAMALLMLLAWGRLRPVRQAVAGSHVGQPQARPQTAHPLSLMFPLASTAPLPAAREVAERLIYLPDWHMRCCPL